MAATDYGVFDDGTPWTIGWCEDPRYLGLMWVSIGGSFDHTTYIVNPADADIRVMYMRGNDRYAWAMIAIAITYGEP